MNDDEIISEIRLTREGHAASCGCDVSKLMAFYREHQEQHPDEGHPVVSFVGEPPRELSLLSPEEQGAEPWEDDEIIAEIRATRAGIAAECGYDVRKIAEHARATVERLRAEGWPLGPTVNLSAPSAVVREDPPQPDRP
jgi:hypothetical protein